MYSDCDLNEDSDEREFSTAKKKIHLSFKHQRSRLNSPRLSIGADDSLDRGSVHTDDKGGNIIFGAGFSEGRSPISQSMFHNRGGDS